MASFLPAVHVAHLPSCHFSKHTPFFLALSTPWLSEACLIKIPLSRLLLMAYVDLSDASLRRKNKRCRFLEKLLQDATKPNLPPNEQFDIARTLRNNNASSVINAFNNHSACLHHFRGLGQLKTNSGFVWKPQKFWWRLGGRAHWLHGWFLSLKKKLRETKRFTVCLWLYSFCLYQL